MTTAATQKVNLGEPLRFRVETSMRKALKAHAAELSRVAGHEVGLGGAVRDLVSRALATEPAAGYESGFREGFIAAYFEVKKKLAERARADRAHESSKARRSPIGPHRGRDITSYRDDDGEDGGEG